LVDQWISAIKEAMRGVPQIDPLIPAELRRTPPRPVVRRLSVFFGLFSTSRILSVMFALIALGFSGYVILERSIQSFGSTIPATFTVASHWTDKKGNEKYSVTYEYDLNGVRQVGEESIREDEYNALPWTKRVVVYQNGSGNAVDQPTTAKVLWLGGHAFVRLTRTSTGPVKIHSDIWIFIAVMGGLFLISYYAAWIWPLRYKRLTMWGRPLMGTITGKRVWRGRNTVYHVNYQFTPSGSKEFKASMTVTRADFDSVQIGDSRAILYDPENPKRSLIYAFGEYKVAG
jgi:hypothetical protein